MEKGGDRRNDIDDLHRFIAKGLPSGQIFRADYQRNGPLFIERSTVGFFDFAAIRDQQDQTALLIPSPLDRFEDSADMFIGFFDE
jgi:hypothetical protein